MSITGMGRSRKAKAKTQVERVPIVEILTHYGASRVPERVRGWAIIRCPFHDDSDASASVNTSEGLFKCHACGMKGDGITLVRQQENCDFASAVQTIESIIGRSINGIRGSATGRGRDSGTGVFDGYTRPVSGQTSLFQTRLR